MQIVKAVMRHMMANHTAASTDVGHQLALCCTDPVEFRANVLEHVAAMAPLGFNSHALGVLAVRRFSLFLGTPQALAAQYTMLRSFFQPYSDELANSVLRTVITPACLPAVAPDSDAARAMRQYGPTRGKAPISQLHKAVLSGPRLLLCCLPERLPQHMRTLVAAGLYATEAEAARACMQLTSLLLPRKLEWYLEHKAAVLEFGGTLDDVRTACCSTASLQAALPCLLLWQRARCAHSTSGKPMRRCHDWWLPVMNYYYMHMASPWCIQSSTRASS